MGRIIFTAVTPPDPTTGERSWVIIPEEMWDQIQLMNKAQNMKIQNPTEGAQIQYVVPTKE